MVSAKISLSLNIFFKYNKAFIFLKDNVLYKYQEPKLKFKLFEILFFI